MKSPRLVLRTAAALAAGITGMGSAFGVVTVITDQADAFGHCDPLFVPGVVDEIGDFTVFPPGERLSHGPGGQGPAPCPVHDLALADPVVVITNLNTFDFVEVWYVADEMTTLTNFDGFVQSPTRPMVAPDLETFKIDAVGVNTPLIFESMTSDGIWEAGETWQFVIQDYTNGMGLAPDLLDSIGLDSIDPPLGPFSSGSIIAIIPEPSGAILLLLGAGGILLRRRRAA